ncbi:MAG: hypothetical protein HY433_03760 [Candidatus Liptonbacteria bacterium]|nr:hypothetical protein [Candidatus Liptonbacteria bacterium]
MDKSKIIILPSIGNYSSRKEWEDACWLKIVTSKELLKLLLTPNERHSLVKRAAAVEGLVAGKSYKQIGNELWLSPQTISCINKALKESGYRSYKERSKTERKKRVYTPGPNSNKIKHRGRSVRTKYGTVYLPY